MKRWRAALMSIPDVMVLVSLWPTVRQKLYDVRDQTPEFRQFLLIAQRIADRF